MNYGYIRVSTDTQSVKNQRYEITQFCNQQSIAIHGWIQETISGTRAYNKRKLGRLLRRVRAGDLIICTELSRLGRNLFMVIEILNHCLGKECRVWTIKEGYRLGDDLESKVLAFAFGISAEIERQLISQRTKEALRRKQEEGVSLGRPRGARNRRYRLDNRAADIHRLLASGTPKSAIARRYRVSRKTLYNWLRRQEAGNVAQNVAQNLQISP